MYIPPLQGNINQTGFFLYAAADPVYFDTHAKPLITSIQANTPHLGCHIHIYNARQDQIEFCNKPGISCSWEQVDDFDTALAVWKSQNYANMANERQRQMLKKLHTESEQEFARLIRNTYFACMRFVRLGEMLNSGQRCLALDVDGLVRRKFSSELGACDFYLYQKPKDKTHLAGALLLNDKPGTMNFIKEYAQQLRSAIERNEIYWFLDQVILDQLVPNYTYGLLPMSYIDWAMRPESAIWSAKGKRKELAVFLQEQRRYQ